MRGINETLEDMKSASQTQLTCQDHKINKMEESLDRKLDQKLGHLEETIKKQPNKKFKEEKKIIVDEVEKMVSKRFGYQLSALEKKVNAI